MLFVIIILNATTSTAMSKSAAAISPAPEISTAVLAAVRISLVQEKSTVQFIAETMWLVVIIFPAASAVGIM